MWSVRERQDRTPEQHKIDDNETVIEEERRRKVVVAGGTKNPCSGSVAGSLARPPKVLPNETQPVVMGKARMTTAMVREAFSL